MSAFLIRVTDKEFEAIIRVAQAFDGLGYAKRGSYGEIFEKFANRCDETRVMQEPDPERCKTCDGSGWVENWPPEPEPSVASSDAAASSRRRPRSTEQGDAARFETKERSA